MIVVVGRPALAQPIVGGADRPAGLAAAVALAAAAAGAPVELAGTVGDDEASDRLAVALGRADVGHAALLRIAGSLTPRVGDPAADAPRLAAGDVDLALRYLPEYRVLVLAEPLAADVVAVALDAAAYHAAAVVALVPDDGRADDRLAERATVLTVPADGEGPFAELVGRYAAGLDAGDAPGVAFAAAVRAVGWEPASAERPRERRA